MRRIILCLIAILVMSFGISVYAEDSLDVNSPSDEGGLFVVQGNTDAPVYENSMGNLRVALYMNDDGNTYTAVFSGTGDLFNLIGEGEYTPHITRIVIEDGITAIAEDAFNNFVGIKEVTIPDSVKKIGKSAFYRCESLTSIEIPEGVTEIEPFCFSECTRLKSVKLPSTVEVIKESAFSATNIDKLVLPEGLKRIEFNAIWNVKSVTVPSTLEYLGDEAFGYDVRNLYINDYNAWLGVEFENENYNPFAMNGRVILNNGQQTDVVIEEGVTRIRPNAFERCDEIKSITLPSTIESIGKNAFLECKNVENIDVTDIESWFKLNMKNNNENPMYFNDGAMLTVSGGQLRNIEVPEGVAAIPPYTFRGWNLLKSITIPESVKSVGVDAFNGCTGLEDIRVDDVNQWLKLTFGSKFSIPTVYGNAQIYTKTDGDYKPVKDVVVDPSIRTIQSYAFNGCDALETVSLHNNLLSIGVQSFAGCGALNQVNIPEGITVINDGAFKDCTSLESIMIPETVSKLGRNIFFGCSDDFIMYGVDGSPAYNAAQRDGIHFQELATMEGVVADGITWKLVGHTLVVSGSGSIPDSTEDADLFPEMSAEVKASITSIRIGGIDGIGANAFVGFDSVKNIALDKSSQVSNIAEGAFGNINTAEVSYYESNPYIEERLRELYPYYTYVVIRNGKAGNLEWVYNSKSKVLSIGCNGADASECNLSESPFKEYKATTVAFREDYSCKDIPANLFKGCTTISEINLPETVTEVGESAFEGCSGLKTVSWYEGIRKIGKRAFCNCSMLSTVELKNNELLDEDGLVDEEVTCEIPDEVVTIEESTFENCGSLQSVIVGGVLNSVDRNAFSNCKNLRKFDIGEAPAVIGSRAFAGDSKLGSEDENAIVLEGTKSIGEEAFLNCPYIHVAYVDGGVQELGAHALGYDYSSSTYRKNANFEVVALAISQALKSYCGSTIPVSIDDDVYGNSDTYVSMGSSRLTLKRNKSATVKFRTNGKVSRITYTKSGSGGVTVLPHKRSVTFKARGSAGQCTVTLRFKMKGRKTITKTVYITSKGGTASVDEGSQDETQVVSPAPAPAATVKPMPKRMTVKAKKNGRKKAIVSWKKVSGVTKYQIQVATNKKFKKAKKYNVSKTWVRKTVKIKKGKKNYIRVRYKYKGKYSSWSKTITLKK